MKKQSKEIVNELKQRGFKVRFHYRRYSAQHLPKNKVKIRYSYKGEKSAEWDTIQRSAVLIGPLSTLKEVREQGLDLWENGGLTKVCITDAQGNNYESEVKCSKSDRFDKEKGRVIALGRAMKQIP